MIALGGGMIYTAHYSSPVGDILIAERDGRLIGSWIEGQRGYSANLGDTKTETTPMLRRAAEWFDDYFDGCRPDIDRLELALSGGQFREEVWNILCEIPYGKVTTYGAIAERVAASRGIPKMSAQAVGNAVGHNPLSIIIPCHRVIGADGSMTGYAGGIGIKRKLLEHEGIDISSPFR